MKVLRKELKTIDYDLEQISKKLDRIGVEIPIAVEILIRYFNRICFISFSKNKKNKIWDLGEQEKKGKNWLIKRSRENPKILKLGDRKVLYRELPKERGILSKFVSSDELTFGDGAFISIKEKKEVKDELQNTLLELVNMPIHFPGEEMIKIDHDTTLLSWINPSIGDEELDIFNGELEKILVDEKLEGRYYPYAAYNSWIKK